MDETTMRFCIKACYTPIDCRGDQVCHRFAQSTVSACISTSREGWLLPSDWKPDERKYWRPTYRWREPASFQSPTPAELVREAAEERRRRSR